MSAEHGHHPLQAHHFQDLQTQTHAARFGMWLFLATELLLFGGLFVGYTFYRTLFNDTFREASHHLNTLFGTIETYDLITSSFAMAAAIYFARKNKRGVSICLQLITAAMGFAFLGMHSYEYYHEYLEGILPGRFYAFHELPGPGPTMFYTHYFLMTGLHSLHVFVGAVIILVLCWHTARGRYSDKYYSGLELGGLYWHLVDLIWIFLYPLFYLA
jgi:cytochrome c oxidase subunit 3